MYIPPGFTVLICEPVDEAALQSWAIANGGVWHPASSKPFRRAKIVWEFPSGCEIAARLDTPTETETAEWTPRMHTLPQNVIDIEIEEGDGSDEAQWTPLLRALLAQWDSYAYDASPLEWIGTLLRDILPAERIIRHEPPPLSAGPAWIWVDGKYTKNEAYHDNLDAATHENQL